MSRALTLNNSSSIVKPCPQTVHCERTLESLLLSWPLIFLSKHQTPNDQVFHEIDPHNEHRRYLENKLAASHEPVIILGSFFLAKLRAAFGGRNTSDLERDAAFTSLKYHRDVSGLFAKTTVFIPANKR